MQRYIIQYVVRRNRGVWETSHRNVEAVSLHEAHKLAIRKSFRAGVLKPAEMRSTTWAKPWTWDDAYDHDLLPYEPMPAHMEAYAP